MSQLSKVLVPNAGVRVVQTTTGDVQLLRDSSWLPFILEELVALGATRAVISGEEIASLPRELRRWVTAAREGVTPTSETFLRPVALAIGMPVNDDGSLDYSGDDAATSDFIDAEHALSTWLVGHRTKCQVSIDIAKSLRSVRRLRKMCKTAGDASMRLAAFEGLLLSYETASVAALVIRSGAEDEALDLFSELLDDAAYRELSQEAFALGWAKKAIGAVRSIGRMTRAIARRPAFKGVLNIGGRAVSTLTGIDMPTHDDLAPLLAGSYSPPLVKVEKGVNTALRRWERANPPMVFISDDRDALSWIAPAKADVRKLLKQLYGIQDGAVPDRQPPKASAGKQDRRPNGS